ncbi:unnamed protein product [Calypogeia fissa]
MASQGYFYNGAVELAPIFNGEPQMCALPGPSAAGSGLMMRSSVNSLRHHLQTEMWMENSMTSTGSTEDSTFLPAMEPMSMMLPAMDGLHHPLHSFKKERNNYGSFSEPTSVLDMHMAPSPGSSPSRSSVYGSPETSSARSVQSSVSRQQSSSSNYSDSPLSTYSYPEERKRNLAKPVSLFYHANAGNDLMTTTSWEDCMGDPHDQGDDILDSLLDGETTSDTQTTSCSLASSHSLQSVQQLENSGDHDHHIHQDLQNFSSDNIDLAEFESMMLLPDPDQEMLTDPLCQLLNEQTGVGTDPLSQMLDSHLQVKFDNFQEKYCTTLQNRSHCNLRSDCSIGSGLEGQHLVEEGQCENLAGFQTQHHQTAERVVQEQLEPETPPQEETGLYLVQLLLGCAEAVEKGNYEMGRQMLSRLTGMASPFGDAMQRIAVYFGEALAEQIAMITDTTYIHTTAASSLKLKSTEAASFSSGPLSLDSHVAYQAYYQVLPYVKFAHFTANQAILEAVGSDDRIHVVDLDIGQGLQWPSFIQSLSAQGKPCHLKITGVGPDRTTLQQTGRRLCEFAASHQVPLEFHYVVETHLENLDAGVLRVHLGESLAVNCANVLNRSLGSHHYYRALEGVLNMVNSLNPIVVAVVEVESHNNLPSFLSRFVEALHHFSALFDCLEATLGRTSTERMRIEKIHFASSIRGILAQEQAHNSVRHIRSDGWEMCFRQAGFKDLPLSGYSVYQAKLLLGLYNGAYKLTGEGTALCLGWQDTPVVSVSAWTC